MALDHHCRKPNGFLSVTLVSLTTTKSVTVAENHWFQR